MAFLGTIDCSNYTLSPDKLQNWRQAFLKILFEPETEKPGSTEKFLAQIIKNLEQSASNEPTVYDNGSFRSSATGTASALTQQVERAITQVLGRAPGRGADSFISALNSAFPTSADGQVTTTPTRSVVSLAGNGTATITADANNGGFNGQLSVSQANLYRQASIIAADALRVLEGLRPFEPTADIDAVDALSALVRSQITALVEEFGRIDQPRKERVDTYLGGLIEVTTTNTQSPKLVAARYLKKLGEQARLINRAEEGYSQEIVFPVTAADEAQVAGFELLVNYAGTLKTIWKSYAGDSDIEVQVTGRYSERLSRASIMLPVIGDSNGSFMSAMDSIGFSASERRSDAALFTSLGLPNEKIDVSLTIPKSEKISEETVTFTYMLPDITVNDFDEWVDRFVSTEAPSILSSSGQFGLDFVTDQADTLFWVIGFVLHHLQEETNAGMLNQVLSYPRVKQTLGELIFQLNTLADLGVGSVSSLRDNRAMAMEIIQTV